MFKRAWRLAVYLTVLLAALSSQASFAYVPFARVSVVETGSTNIVSVPFPYAQQSDIFVYVNGVLVSGYTWLTSSTIQLTQSASSLTGATVMVERGTQVSTPNVTFAPGSLDPNDLNTSEVQNLYALQEHADFINDIYSRALMLPSGYTIGAFPSPSTCAGKFVGFDATGLNPACGTPITTVVGGAGGVVVDALAAGCPADGVTDAGPCINALLSAQTACVGLTPTVLGFNIITTVVVNNGACLEGTVWQPNSPLAGFAGTSWLKCSTSAVVNGICLKKTGSNSNVGASIIKDITLAGIGGTPAAGSIGYYDYSGFNDTSYDIDVTGFDTCATWGPGGGTNHISSWNFNFNASYCYSHFLVNDGWPELHIVGGRLGTNGGAEPVSTGEYLDLERTGTEGGAGGPNTTVIENMQWNTGGTVGCSIRWENWTGSGGIQGTYRFTDVHSEWAQLYTGAKSTGVFCTDSTVPVVQTLDVFSSDFDISSPATGGVFNFNAATALNKVRLVGNVFGCPGGLNLTVNSTVDRTYQTQYFTDNEFCGPAVLTAGTLSYLNLDGNVFANGLTITGVWKALNAHGNMFGNSASGPTFVDTATSAVSGSISLADGLYDQIAWTPTLTFGGASVGITYGTQTGAIWRTATGGFAGQYSITLTSKGSSSGASSIGTLPYRCANGARAGLPNTLTGMTGLTGTMNLNLNAQNTLVPVQTTAATNAILTDASFTNTSSMTGTFSCDAAF